MISPRRARGDNAETGPGRSARPSPTANLWFSQPLPPVWASPGVNSPPLVACAASDVDKPARPINIVTMDRRTFVLLTGGVSSGLIVPPSTALHRPPSGVAGIGRLRFELDEHRRWSLWDYGDAAPGPLLRDAEVVTWLADPAIGLTDLEDSTVGTRRPPGGQPPALPGPPAAARAEA